MDRYEDLSWLESPRITSEKDLFEIVDCIDRTNFQWPYEQYKLSSQYDIMNLLRSLKDIGKLEKTLTFCDIGFGSGVILAVFALLGHKTYGIDKEKQAIQHAPGFFQRVQNRLGRFEFQPQLLKAQLNQGEILDVTFADNTLLKDIAIYYSYINDEFNLGPYIMQAVNASRGALSAVDSLVYTPKHKHPGAITWEDIRYRIANASRKNDTDQFMQQGYVPIFEKVG